uniref:Putative lipase n=1 Tax=Albugo laibachii Nc14 TaxID=890382 RepID=F0WHF3_9STRA|nr:putative lipase [Albugo laibachii Nc14]|eukprot:CCA20672.1 putative lipase [Albugo laibachii Nc14]
MAQVIFMVALALWSHQLIAAGEEDTAFNHPPRVPIILVHGFGGWEPEVFPRFLYWGKFHGDLRQKLEDEGHEVYTASIGPFSSNWDRACELYAVVKGGRVDYGHGHAEKYKHKQLGRHYKGLYERWGGRTGGRVNKVHIIAHSMGGPTVRMLSHLLSFGVKDSGDAMDAMVDESHPFYHGGRDWIESITFLESPLYGTVFANLLIYVKGILVPTMRAGLYLNGLFRSSKPYDPKLDQWNVDSLATYKKFVSRWIWKGESHKDTALYSLTTYGAAEENKWIKESDKVFYFIYSTGHQQISRGFFRDLITHFKYERVIQHFLVAKSMIRKWLNEKDSIMNKDWGVSNDGVVETSSMIHKGQCIDLKKTGTTELIRGSWYSPAHFPYAYHSYATGRCPEVDCTDFVIAHASLLRYIAKNTTASPALNRMKEEVEVFDNLRRAIEEYHEATVTFARKFLE